MDFSLADSHLSLPDLNNVVQSLKAHIGDMLEDDGDISMPGTPILESNALSPDQLALEKQRATLKTYLDSLPYACESEEVIHEKLGEIVGKMAIAVETKNWPLLCTWDGVLQWYARYILDNAESYD